MRLVNRSRTADADDFLFLAEARLLCESGEAKVRRLAARLSQQHMADRCETTRMSVSRWERKLRRPSGRQGAEFGRALIALEGVIRAR